MSHLNIFVVKLGGVVILIAKNIQRYALKMKSKLAFKLKQVKIHKKLNDLLKKYIEDKKVYSDLSKLRELIDEQDKLIGVE